MVTWLNGVASWWNAMSSTEMVWTALSWIMSAIALAGTLMNAERNKWGFAFWLISNLYMSVRFFIIGEYAQSALFFVYFLLAIRGIFAWTKKEKKDSENQDA